MNIIIFGKPGSGKGTQAELITKKFNFNHISTGELLRQEVEKNGEYAETIQKCQEKGELVPIDTVLELLQKNLEKDNLFDGFPRDLEQAEALDEITEIDLVINLEVPDNVVADRLSARGRKDDTEETIRNRLKIYNDLTDPLLEYYKPRDIIRTIDGTQTVEAIHEEIKEIIEHHKRAA
jgi:adenylate kinase